MDAKKLADVGIFKAALEFARFSSPEVRESLVKAINALDADLEEVNYIPSDLTMEAFDDLVECLDAESEDGGPTSNTSGLEVEDEDDDSIEDFITDSADEAEVEEVEFDDDEE